MSSSPDFASACLDVGPEQARGPTWPPPTNGAKLASVSAARGVRPCTFLAPTPASALIDGRIAELADWRGQTLARDASALIHEVDPDVVEEWKWMGTPIWSHDGIICTGESYKSVVKLTCARGAVPADPTRLFNSSLEGNVRRAIDIHEGEAIDAAAFKALVAAAIALNVAAKSNKSSKKAKAFNQSVIPGSAQPMSGTPGLRPATHGPGLSAARLQAGMTAVSWAGSRPNQRR